VEAVDVDGDLASGQLLLLSQDAHRRQEAMKDRWAGPSRHLLTPRALAMGSGDMFE
jgi:hypothetical protein